MDEITIYDIAKKAGVSAATVSRVINNYAHVKKETRAKVLKILEESNYVPNETARNLVNQSTKMVGILIADIRTTHHTEGVYYVEQAFSKKGYTCLIYNTGFNPDQMASYIQLLSQKKIDAVIMMGSIYQNDSVKQAIETYIPSIPVAICNGYLDCSNVYGVVSDERKGVFDCVRLLSSKGRKRIALISYPLTPSNQEKVDGYKEGISAFSDNKPPIVEITESTMEAVTIATEKVLNENPEVDAIIYSEDFPALVGIHCISAMGRRIPEDIAIVGINNSRYSQVSVPSLTSLDNMLYDTSLTAVRNILQVLAGEHVSKKMIICSRVVERSST